MGRRVVLSHYCKLKFGSMFSQHVAQFTLSRFFYLSFSILYFLVVVLFPGSVVRVEIEMEMELVIEIEMEMEMHD